MSGVSHLVNKLRTELKSRGAHGIHGLGRKFKIMDDDGSKSLNMAEFKKAMKEMNIESLNEADLRYSIWCVVLLCPGMSGSVWY